MAKIIDGKKIAAEIREEIKQKALDLKLTKGVTPGLALLLVGTNPASEIYVRSKIKACEEAGFNSFNHVMSDTATEEEVLAQIDHWNKDENVHGILVQMPLPKHINEQKVIRAISPAKDVDGFHPENIGRLVIGLDSFVPCTPLGILEMIKRSGISLSGKHVVVVGRSNIVGKPIANLLYQKKPEANAIVTICHTGAQDLSRYTRDADVIIAAVGKPNAIKADDVKEGAVIIDVGINRVADETKPKGYRIVGDVDYEGVFDKVSAITPVPGGVGPLTIAMLLSNTYKSAASVAWCTVLFG
ncbi:MAG: bifunctional methylenetetrahydrofolate dehydrogenase/methenyltetrahydrofolate cyclohydrolase FolD [Chloroflexota bacterium]